MHDSVMHPLSLRGGQALRKIDGQERGRADSRLESMQTSGGKDQQSKHNGMKQQAQEREKTTKCSPLQQPKKRQKSEEVEEFGTLKGKWRKRKHRGHAMASVSQILCKPQE